MALVEQNAPLRDRMSFAHWFRKLLLLKFSKPTHTGAISGRLARDIGLKPHEFERMKLRLPSETRIDL